MLLSTTQHYSLVARQEHTKTVLSYATLLVSLSGIVEPIPKPTRQRPLCAAIEPTLPDDLEVMKEGGRGGCILVWRYE